MKNQPRRLRAGAVLAGLVLALAACGGTSEELPVEEDVQDVQEETVEPAAPQIPAADVDVVNDWAEVESDYSYDAFRVIRINGECFVEQDGYGLVPGGTACEQ